MKILIFIMIITCSISNGCAQNKINTEFEGRIYIIESQNIFFRLESNGVANYYTIEEGGQKSVSSHLATWKILLDTTLVLNVVFTNEDVEHEYRYNREKDYWIDSDSISVFRRIKHINYKEFNLKEFSLEKRWNTEK